MSVVEEIELGGGRPLEGAAEVRGAGPVERAAPAVLGDDELEVGQPVEGATEARGEAVELAAPAQAAQTTSLKTTSLKTRKKQKSAI